MSDLSNMLAVARDAALEALDHGEPVGWIGGPVPDTHCARLLVASPVVGDPEHRAVWRLSGDAGEWFFTPYARSRSMLLMPTVKHEINLTRDYLWTLRRVQEGVARALGLLDLDKISTHLRRPVSMLPLTRSEIAPDLARARRREKRRANMSPAEKERFDTRQMRTR